MLYGRAKHNRKLIKPLPQTDVNNIGIAINDLRIVRERLVFAGAPRAAKAVARALKSVEGAMRHAQHRKMRAEEKTCERC